MTFILSVMRVDATVARQNAQMRLTIVMCGLVCCPSGHDEFSHIVPWYGTSLLLARRLNSANIIAGSLSEIDTLSRGPSNACGGARRQLTEKLSSRFVTIRKLFKKTEIPPRVTRGGDFVYRCARRASRPVRCSVAAVPQKYIARRATTALGFIQTART